jgi:WS/DGAT/MGAT family acyltransferase
MRRLDGVSTFLLVREEPGAYQHTFKIGIYDPREVPGGWCYERFHQDLAASIAHGLPLFRCKIQRVPFDLHHPLWVDDPDFDLDYHLHRIACPQPGDARTFCALLSQLYAWPLDHSRPLWLSWIVEGLENGRVAVVTLLHHAYTDGTGAARLMGRYFKKQPEQIIPDDSPPWSPEPAPGKLRLVLSALRAVPIDLAHGLPKVVRGLAKMRRLREEYIKGGRELPPTYRDAPDSPFNILLSNRRTFVFETFPFEEIRTTTRGFGVTVNDLFLATVAGVFRQFMQERGCDVDRGPLVAMIPVEQRPPIEKDDFVGNRTSATYVSLPIHIADAVARLSAARHASRVMKEHFEASKGADLLSLIGIMPVPMLRLPDWLVKRSKSKVGMNGNVILSNVKGPSERLYLGQLPLVNWISTGQILHGVGINVTVWSYAGNFNLCILADKKLLPDGWPMIDRFREAFTEYANLSGASKFLNSLGLPPHKESPDAAGPTD